MKNIALVLFALTSSAFAGSTYVPATQTPRFTVLGPNVVTFYDGQKVAALVKTDSTCMPRHNSKIEIVGQKLTKHEGRLRVDGRVCEVVYVDAFDAK